MQGRSVSNRCLVGQLDRLAEFRMRCWYTYSSAGHVSNTAAKLVPGAHRGGGSSGVAGGKCASSETSAGHIANAAAKFVPGAHLRRGANNKVASNEASAGHVANAAAKLVPRAHLIRSGSGSDRRGEED